MVPERCVGSGVGSPALARALARCCALPVRHRHLRGACAHHTAAVSYTQTYTNTHARGRTRGDHVRHAQSCGPRPQTGRVCGRRAAALRVQPVCPSTPACAVWADWRIARRQWGGLVWKAWTAHVLTHAPLSPSYPSGACGRPTAQGLNACAGPKQEEHRGARGTASQRACGSLRGHCAVRHPAPQERRACMGSCTPRTHALGCCTVHAPTRSMWSHPALPPAQPLPACAAQPQRGGRDRGARVGTPACTLPRGDTQAAAAHTRTGRTRMRARTSGCCVKGRRLARLERTPADRQGCGAHTEEMNVSSACARHSACTRVRTCSAAQLPVPLFHAPPCLAASPKCKSTHPSPPAAAPSSSATSAALTHACGTPHAHAALIWHACEEVGGP